MFNDKSPVPLMKKFFSPCNGVEIGFRNFFGIDPHLNQRIPIAPFICNHCGKKATFRTFLVQQCVTDFIGQGNLFQSFFHRTIQKRPPKLKTILL
jgi:hypothetical protein